MLVRVPRGRKCLERKASEIHFVSVDQSCMLELTLTNFRGQDCGTVFVCQLDCAGEKVSVEVGVCSKRYL